jgi:anti-anti-sigma factor
MEGSAVTAPRTWRLELTRQAMDGVFVVAVAGRLGTQSSGELIEALVQATLDGHRRILCDLGAVDYVSSAGLLALDAASGRIGLDGGELVLCNLTDPVRLVLDLSGLLPHFTVAASTDAGLALLRKAGTP